jgi:SOS-response transcriptional repressor LexA
MEARLIRGHWEPCGVMVFDPLSGKAAFRFRRDWNEFAGEEASTLEALAADLQEKFREMGAQSFLAWVDSDLSGWFSVDDKAEVLGRNVETTAQALYRRHVHTKPLEGVTHLPLYSIRAAAGGFGPDAENEIEEWVEVHGQQALRKEEFVLRITGRSMEPDIPDGALCLFRQYSGGSRAGQIVLVQRISESDSGGEVTIKRYSSAKTEDGGSWQHTQIGMHPENPEFQGWQLDEAERLKTIAVFVRVLEEPLN